MFEISKNFQICYAHRVFSQNVNEKYSGSSDCPCQKIHGHGGVITVSLSAPSLDTRGFVIDYKELSFVRDFLDNNIDHRFIISDLDPGFLRLVGYTPAQFKAMSSKISLLDEVGMGYRTFDDSDVHLDSFVMIENINPTSENLSKWVYEGIEKVINLSEFDCTVNYVDWSETAKTHARYSK